MSNHVVINTSLRGTTTASVDRPFEMTGVRDQLIPFHDVPNKNLTQAESQKMALSGTAPNPTARSNASNDKSSNAAHLNAMTAEANEKEQKEFEERKLYNLSVKQIAYRISDTWTDILDDMLNFDRNDGFRGFLEIYLKEDRLIYFGITLMIFVLIALLVRSV